MGIESWHVSVGFGDVLMGFPMTVYAWPVKGGPIFADGFGSADTRRWSVVEP